MAINNSGDAATKNQSRRYADYTRIDPGPYIGIVKDNVDPTSMGALRVLIPSLPPGGEDGYDSNLIRCNYLNPFYGVKSQAGVDPTAPADYESTQHSYGMWFVPPDIDSKVMVIFVEGKRSQGYWMGCVMEPVMNHMIPGIASSENALSRVQASEGSLSRGQSQNEIEYGTDNLPVGEINRSLYNSAQTGTGLKQKKPIHPQADILARQGLISDTVRGTTSSSARRESPSQVYGISTPGPINRSSKKKSVVGALDKQNLSQLVRKPGHTFVMDDGDENENNKLIRLRTGGGHQILMHDTENVIYIANATGNAWMEFSQSGRIDVYSADSINLRSSTNFNIHSDAGINLFAKDTVKIRGKNGVVIDGANITNYADMDIINQATQGYVTTRAAGSIFSYAGISQWHNSAGEFHLSGQEVHFNTKGVNSSLVREIKRTKYYDITGTTTIEEDVEDVIAVDKQNIIKRKAKGNTTMSGIGQIPTHEPAIHANNVKTFNGSLPDNKNNLIPGTPEFVADQNRKNALDIVRIGQCQADTDLYLRKYFPNASKEVLQKEAKKFIDGYAKSYNVPENLNLSFLTSGVSDAVNQVTESITGSAVNLLKDQVFINDNNILYTAGDLSKRVVGTSVGVIKDLSEGKSLSTTVGNVLGGSIKLPGGDIGISLPAGIDIKLSIPGVDKVTNTIKTVVGGSVTSVTQITSAINRTTNKVIGSVGRAIGKIFG